jgi:6-phosphogluconolactonase
MPVDCAAARGGWESCMRLEMFADAEQVAREAAAFVAREAQVAVAARGQFVLAVSGGHTPWQMLAALAQQSVPWKQLQIVQVDERVAPAGDPARNLTHLTASLLSRAPLAREQIHAMPVEDENLQQAADDYAAALARLAGTPPVLDLVHLGLGPDGHTASLVPGDGVLAVRDKDVAVTGMYQGHRRMTLTYPPLDRARCVLWLVTGAEKAPVLPRLLAADQTIPAGRVCQERARVFADRLAAVQVRGTP